MIRLPPISSLPDPLFPYTTLFLANGVKKGDRVTIYLPMIPAAAYAMLACARIGAVHSIVFGGFSPDSLANRIQDCDSQFVITADEGLRGGRPVPLKRSEEHPSELPSLMRISYAVFCLQKKTN